MTSIESAKTAFLWNGVLWRLSYYVNLRGKLWKPLDTQKTVKDRERPRARPRKTAQDRLLPPPPAAARHPPPPALGYRGDGDIGVWGWGVGYKGGWGVKWVFS